VGGAITCKGGGLSFLLCRKGKRAPERADQRHGRSSLRSDAPKRAPSGPTDHDTTPPCVLSPLMLPVRPYGRPSGHDLLVEMVLLPLAPFATLTQRKGKQVPYCGSCSEGLSSKLSATYD